MTAKHTKDAPPAERLAAIRERRRELLEAQRILAARRCTIDEARAKIREHIARVAEMQPVSIAEKARWFVGAGAPPTAFDTVVPRAGDPWIGSFVVDVCKDLVEARLVAALDDVDFTGAISDADLAAYVARCAALGVPLRQGPRALAGGVYPAVTSRT